MGMFNTSWFQLNNSSEFDVIRKKHKDGEYLIRALDAYINKPNQSNLEIRCKEIQKLLKFAQMYGFEKEQIELLKRYSEMKWGNREGKVTILKAKEEAERYGNDVLLAECLVMLAAQCKPEEQDEFTQCAKEAEEIITDEKNSEMLGKSSLTFARLQTAKAANEERKPKGDDFAEAIQSKNADGTSKNVERERYA